MPPTSTNARYQSTSLLKVLEDMNEGLIGNTIQSSILTSCPAHIDNEDNVVEDDGEFLNDASPAVTATTATVAGGKRIEAAPMYLSVPDGMGGTREDVHGPLEFVLIEKQLVYTNKPQAVDNDAESSPFLSPSHLRHTEAILAKIPHSIRSRIPLFDSLARTFGALPMIALFLSYFLSKGIGAHLVSSGTLPIFKDVFKVSGGRYQAFVTITILGWSFKPILGLVSDLVAIRGYNKRGWLVLAAATGAVCALVFMVLPGPSNAQEAKTGWFVGISVAGAACAFFISVAQAALDLLFEGYYCSLMQLSPEQSSSLVSWVWGATMTGGIVAAAMEGPIADYLSPRVVLAIVTLSMLLVLPVLYQNWIGETPFLRIIGQRRGGGDDSRQQRRRMVHTSIADSSTTIEMESTQREVEDAGDTISFTSNRGGGDDDSTVVRHGLLSHVADTTRDALPSSTASSSLGFKACEVVELPQCMYVSPIPTFIYLSAKSREHRRVVLYAGLMGVSAVAIALSTLHFSSLAAQDDSSGSGGTGSMSAATLGKLQLLGVTATASIVLSIFSFKALPRAIASANVFMFLKEMLYVQMPGPLDYFFTAGPSCLPNGPHFSYTYYQTFTSIVGYVAGGVGVAIFYRYFSKRSFRTTFYITTAIRVVASLFDLMLVTRTNQTFFGGLIWPLSLLKEDKVFYFFGDAIIFQAVSMMDFMPMVMLTSKMCPKGLECTTYAILAGFSNFGQVISNSIGSLLIAFIFPITMGSDDEGITSTTTLVDGGTTTAAAATVATQQCDFSNLPSLLIVGHLLMPLLVIPLVPLLVPSQRMDEEVVHDDIPSGLDVTTATPVTSTTEPNPTY